MICIFKVILHFLSALGLAWQARFLKKTEVAYINMQTQVINI